MINTHALRVFKVRLRLVTVALVASVFAVGLSTAAVPSSAAGSPVAPASIIAVPAAADAFASDREKDRALAVFDRDGWNGAAVRAIEPEVLRLALGASRCAVVSGAVNDPSSLTIIDYSKPSVEPRLWVLDLATREVVYEELVAHGQGSGGNVATKFSNVPDSHQTSIGLFVTADTYVGRNGYSLRLNGLDAGFNDRARERAIVMHGAPYVNDDIGKALGRLGRSHGCPAVRAPIARELIDRVKGGNLVFSYYPDAEWLEKSQYLGACGQ